MNRPSALRPDPTTALARHALSHRLGTHLVADESTATNVVNRAGQVSVAETVLYMLRGGSLRVTLVTRPDGSMFPNGTIAKVRVVEGGNTLDEVVEVGAPRLSVSRDEVDRSQFNLRVDSGTLDPAHAEIFAEAVSVANALIERMTYADRGNR